MPAKVSRHSEIALDSGEVVATVAQVHVGGGTQNVNVDGTVEERVHGTSTVFHARLASQDRTVPDRLEEFATFDDALACAEAYAERVEAARAAAADLLAG